MSAVMIRDDDANATTDPARLERLYAPLLDRGVPVSFAVVPAVALDTRGPAGAREGFILEGEFATREVALTAGHPLAHWLRTHRGRGVSVLTHGLSHARHRGGTEFGALSLAEATARIERAQEILHGALGAAPSGFVAPWDALSRGALVATTRSFRVLSTGFVDRTRLPLAAWPGHLRERVTRAAALRVGGAWVVRHGGCRLHDDTPPEAVSAIVDGLVGRARVAVIVLHHWALWQRKGTHPVIVALADALRGRRCVGADDVSAELDARARRD